MSVDAQNLQPGHRMDKLPTLAPATRGPQRAAEADPPATAATSERVEEPSDDAGGERASWRESIREQALNNAMRKRAAGVPTYSVPEAAALMSISQEYLYRLIQARRFPAVHMRLGAGQGRYVIPATAVERLLDHASDGCSAKSAKSSEE